MPNTVYMGGRVLVGDGATTPANAVVVHEGRVAAVGTRDAMVRIGGRGAEQVDVHGATILPGLVDTHPHLMHFGTFAEPLVDIADARRTTISSSASVPVPPIRPRASGS